ncbi:glycosyltransferase [bacterium]|nr:MAG: glycosyltransferase [bacterium]
MNILHVTPHMGGGIGTVLMGWIDKAIAANDHDHRIVSLDYVNDKAMDWANKKGFPLAGNMAQTNQNLSMLAADIVLCHFWDHPTLAELFSRELPPCRLVFWLHKNTLEAMTLPVEPDWVIKTSPVQGAGKYIWSTGDMARFFEIQPKPHKGFNVGYCGTIDYKKIHPNFIKMCREIIKKIPDVHFTFMGDASQEILLSLFQPPPLPPFPLSGQHFTFTGKVDDIAPYLAEMDVFGYPLRSDNYGTCEQVLGEAMCAGVVPVVMSNMAEMLIVQAGATSPSAYVDTVKALYDFPEQRKLLSDTCRRFAKSLYSIDTMIYQWDEVFESMMKEPKKKRVGNGDHL